MQVANLPACVSSAAKRGFGIAPLNPEANMTRTDRYRNWSIATCALAALLISPAPASAAPDACPAPVANHIPAPPPPPLNIDTVKDLLLDYHQQYYDTDIAAVFDSAEKFVEQDAAHARRPALVLDIDETSLTNWPSLLADNFGYVAGGACDALPAGPCGFNQWILKSSAKAIGPARKLFDTAKANGVAVIFITGRPDWQRKATILNLIHEGYDGWTELRTRPDRDDLPNVQTYKTAERTKVEAEGYTIIANVGDQISDLDGEHSGCRFKVPNPFYFIR
jgi:acid phosphatase